MSRKKLLEKAKRTIDRHRLLGRREQVVVGVSGGPDSVCLLHVLRKLAPQYGVSLHTAHLNHELRGDEAEEDARYVSRLADTLRLPATIGRCDVYALARREKLSLEEAARRARYSFLQKVGQETASSIIAVGHNADDQVETVIMHWLRGAGLAGLRGMEPSSLLGAFRLVRPLLEVGRDEILAYCREAGLAYRFDRSNLDQTFFRNRIRHELIPLLETYNPRIREVLRRTASSLGSDYDYLQRCTAELWQELVEEEGEGFSFPLNPWQELHPSLQRYLLREAIRHLRRNLRNINWVHIQQALAATREKPAGTTITLPQRLALYLGYDRFTIGEAPPLGDFPLLTEPHKALRLRIPGVTPLPGSTWQVAAEILPRQRLPSGWEENPDPWLAYLDYQSVGDELLLRGRRRGDRFQPLGMEQGKSVSQFMIDSKVPRYVRDRLPLVCSSAHIVWIPGWRIDERAKITASTKRALTLRFVRDASNEENPIAS